MARPGWLDRNGRLSRGNETGYTLLATSNVLIATSHQRRHRHVPSAPLRLSADRRFCADVVRIRGRAVAGGEYFGRPDALRMVSHLDRRRRHRGLDWPLGD